MRNSEVIEMIDRGLTRALNREVIAIKPVKWHDGRYALEVCHILGANVDWIIGEFEPVDFYEYFKDKLIDDILYHLLNKRNIGRYVGRFNHSLINWMQDDAAEVVHSELMKFVTSQGISWSLFYDMCMNKMAQAGFLSASIYYNIVSGFYENVSNEHINIKVESTAYRTRQGAGELTITFLDSTEITLNEDFFVGYQFFNELIRESKTESLLKSIEDKLREVLRN